jgi:hypothetical protein
MSDPGADDTWVVGDEIEGLGDVDGDTYSDCAILSRSRFVRAVGEAGELWFVSGASGIARGSVRGAPPSPRMRGFLDCSVDVNGDGIRDAVVGCPEEVREAGGVCQGAVRVYSGMDASPLLELGGEPGDGLVGRDGSSVPDVDGDGRGEVALVVARTRGAGEPASGLVRIYSGRTGNQLQAHGRDGWLPFRSMGTPDLDGDGAGDVVVAWKPGWTEDREARPCQVTAVSGKDGKELWCVPGARGGGQLGSRMSGGRDLDGDGIPDVVLLEPRAHMEEKTEEGPRVTTGVHRLYRGRIVALSGRDGHLLWELAGETSSHQPFWSDVAVVEDADGDGVPDVCGGAPGSDPDEEDVLKARGSVFVISGLDGRVLRRIVGDRSGEGFGTSLAFLESTGPRGVPGVLVSAPGVFLQEGWGGGRVVAMTLGGERTLEWGGGVDGRCPPVKTR